MISKDEIVTTLKPINNNFFIIPDLDEYANKVIKFGKALYKRNSNSELISYILYYDNGENVFVTMVWTKDGEQGKGLAKELILKLINSNQKDVVLEVNPKNSAIFLYKKLKFVEEIIKGENIIMRYSKSLSIMQPYIFPYIGYFQLIEASDKIVFYDDVNYIKGGWINRNRILLNNHEFLFTVPVAKASPNKLIKEIVPLFNTRLNEKLLCQIQSAYKKAPYFSIVMEFVEVVLNAKYDSVADMAIQSIISVYKYLGKDINWIKSSECSPNSIGLSKADRVIEITKNLGYEKYVNVIGGITLYNKEYFLDRGIELKFIKSNNIEYKQFNNDFIPWLSILDILMFNNKATIKENFSAYHLE